MWVMLVIDPTIFLHMSMYIQITCKELDHGRS